MKHLSIATVTVGIAALVVGSLGLPIGPALAQGGPGQMMGDWGWGGGFVWLMPLAMMAWFALMIAVIVLLVRWLGGGSGGRIVSTRTTARDILDERYARGEIDREEYLQRQKDIRGD